MEGVTLSTPGMEIDIVGASLRRDTHKDVPFWNDCRRDATCFSPYHDWLMDWLIDLLNFKPFLIETFGAFPLDDIIKW